MGENAKNAGVRRPRSHGAGDHLGEQIESSFNFRAAPPSAGRNVTPVQVELSLEKVKVVHNDLTDADVEIVPMKSRPAREAVARSRRKNRGRIWANGS